MIHLPASSSPTGHQQHVKDDSHNGDLHLSSAAKSRHTTRLQRTNSYLDKSPGGNSFGVPMRSESYRSSRLDYGLRPRHTSSKQRNYVNSKTSFHDLNGGELYVSATQDENTHHHPQQQLNINSSTQRLNASSFDLTASRKPLSPNKSNTFNLQTNGTGHHAYFNSTQDLHRTDTNVDRSNLTKFVARGTTTTTSKEQIQTVPKYRQTSSVPINPMPANGTTSNTPGERRPSAQSYKSRDANISYAYTDVKKYIEENELMSPEKEQIIRNWIIDVEKNRHQLQKIE
jgi:hypothetical protein